MFFARISELIMQFGEKHKKVVVIMYEIFKKLLDEHGVTAYQVSKMTGISTGSLSDWKNGRSSPKADKLQKIADYFGVTVDYLLGNEQKEKPVAKSDEPDYEKAKEILAKRLEQKKNGLVFGYGDTGEPFMEEISEQEMNVIRNILKLSRKKDKNK